MSTAHYTIPAQLIGPPRRSMHRHVPVCPAHGCNERPDADYDDGHSCARCLGYFCADHVTQRGPEWLCDQHRDEQAAKMRACMLAPLAEIMHRIAAGSIDPETAYLKLNEIREALAGI